MGQFYRSGSQSRKLTVGSLSTGYSWPGRLAAQKACQVPKAAAAAAVPPSQLAKNDLSSTWYFNLMWSCLCLKIAVCIGTVLLQTWRTGPGPVPAILGQRLARGDLVIWIQVSAVCLSWWVDYCHPDCDKVQVDQCDIVLSCCWGQCDASNWHGKHSLAHCSTSIPEPCSFPLTILWTEYQNQLSCIESVLKRCVALNLNVWVCLRCISEVMCAYW